MVWALPLAVAPEPRRHAIGRQIQAQRLARGLTQEQAAATAGVSVGAWRSTEAGTRRPRPQTFAAILSVLDLTSDDMRGTAADPEVLESCRRELLEVAAGLAADLVPLVLEVTRLLEAGHRASGEAFTSD